MTALSERRAAAEPTTPRHRDPEFSKDSGRGWFPQDAENHRRDAPRFCPGCAVSLTLADGGAGLATEYWLNDDRVFVCVCGACGWTGDIVLPARVVGHEPEH